MRKRQKTWWRKIKTYSLYFWEDLLFVDFKSIRDSFRYIFRHQPPHSDRLIASRMGLIYTRAGTTDFIYANYAYEFYLKKFINKHINNFDCFLDVGSCIGEYSVWLAKQGKTCFCFEPVDENVAILKKNLELNHVTQKATVYSFALGSENGTDIFNIQKTNKGASGVARLQPQTDRTFSATINTFDHFFESDPFSHTLSVLMKIDAEGMEVDVIRGAAKFIGAAKRLIIIYEAKHSDNQGITDVLQKLGTFSTGWIDAHNCYAIKQHNGQG